MRVSSRRSASRASQNAPNARSSPSRPAACSTSACGSRSSRPATSSSIALCASLPAAERAENANGGRSPARTASNNPAHRARSPRFDFPSHNGSGSSNARAASSTRSRRRGTTSGGSDRRSVEPISPSRVRRCDGVSSAVACTRRMVGVAADMPEAPDDILRALADPERLAIAGHLARANATASAIAETLDVPLARVRRHLNRLVAAGVVRLGDDRRTYRLDPETLRWAAEQVGPPRGAGLALGAATEDEESVLRAFFRDGRLTEIPAKESKRRIVLERIALEFEPGVRYDEPTVNAIVGRFSLDHAALRRYLVDEGFLDRDHGEYWRGGGRVET